MSLNDSMDDGFRDHKIKVSINDVKPAKSLSHIDKSVIQKGDVNIKKLLKRIDRSSVNYLEWMRK